MDRETARQLLEKKRSATEALIAAERAAASSDDTDMGSGADTFEREQALTVLRMEEVQRTELEDALDRVAAGTFGRCEACGAVIDDARLAACPETRFCVVHEREAERLPPWHEAMDPGWRALDELPDDLDELDADDETTIAAEEAALHVEEPA